MKQNEFGKIEKAFSPEFCQYFEKNLEKFKNKENLSGKIDMFSSISSNN